MATAVDARVAHALGCGDRARVDWRPRPTLLSLIGLLIQVVGYALGWRGDESAAIGLWYIGFVGIVVPFAWLLLAPSRTGHQRLGAALAFGLIMYASWYLTDPIMATRFDETLHVTTLVDMVDQHSFFYPNTTLPVSPHYPGLEFATAGVHWLTGLPLIVCQVLVVVAARSTFILALFLLASRIGRSTQVGAATVLLYAGSAQFYFFNSQYSYQTVAIAMLMAALYLLVRAFDSEEERPWRLLLGVQVCLGGAGHHPPPHQLADAGRCCGLLALFFWRGGEERRARLTLITAEVATVVVLAWTAIIAPLLISYLGPIFDVATSQLHQRPGRQRQRPRARPGGDGTPTPTWELMVMAGSILLWLAHAAARRLAGLAARQPRPDPRALRAAGDGGGLPRAPARPVRALGRRGRRPGLDVRHHGDGAGRRGVAGTADPELRGAGRAGAGRADPRRHPHRQRPRLAAGARALPGRRRAALDRRRDRWPWPSGPAPTCPRARAWPRTRRSSGCCPTSPRCTTITQPAGFDSMTPLFIAHSVDEEVLEADPPQRRRLHRRRHPDGRPDRAVGRLLRGQHRLRPGRADDQPRPGARSSTTSRGFDLVLDGPVKVYDVRPLRHADQTFSRPHAAGAPRRLDAVAGAGHGMLLRRRVARPWPAPRPPPVPRARRLAAAR